MEMISMTYWRPNISSFLTHEPLHTPPLQNGSEESEEEGEDSGSEEEGESSEGEDYSGSDSDGDGDDLEDDDDIFVGSLKPKAEKGSKKVCWC